MADVNVLKINGNIKTTRPAIIPENCVKPKIVRLLIRNSPTVTTSPKQHPKPQVPVPSKNVKIPSKQKPVQPRTTPTVLVENTVTSSEQKTTVTPSKQIPVDSNIVTTIQPGEASKNVSYGYKYQNGKRSIELSFCPFSEIEEDHAPDWNTKFRPTRVSDVAGNNDSVAKARNCFDRYHRKMNDTENIEWFPSFGLILVGPPGCGKTSVAKAICEEYKYDLKEINQDTFAPAQVQDTKKRKVHKGNHPRSVIDSVIKPMFCRQLLPGEQPFAILIEQAEHLDNSIGESFYTELAKWLSPESSLAENNRLKTQDLPSNLKAGHDEDTIHIADSDHVKIPWKPFVFLTVNDRFSPCLKVLLKKYYGKGYKKVEIVEEKSTKKGKQRAIALTDVKDKKEERSSYVPCELVYMNRVEEWEAKTRLEYISKKNGMSITDDQLLWIARECNGDMRKSVMILELVSRSCVPSGKIRDDEIKKLCDIWTTTDTFHSTCDNQIIKELTERQTFDELITCAENHFFLSTHYLWANIPNIIEQSRDCMGTVKTKLGTKLEWRPHPSNSLAAITASRRGVHLSRNKDIEQVYLPETMDLMAEVAECYSYSDVIEKAGGWKDIELGGYRDVLSVAAPILLTRDASGSCKNVTQRYRLEHPAVYRPQDPYLKDFKKRFRLDDETVFSFCNTLYRTLYCWKRSVAEMQKLVYRWKRGINVSFHEWKNRIDRRDDPIQVVHKPSALERMQRWILKDRDAIFVEYGPIKATLKELELPNVHPCAWSDIGVFGWKRVPAFIIREYYDLELVVEARIGKESKYAVFVNEEEFHHLYPKNPKINYPYEFIFHARKRECDVIQYKISTPIPHPYLDVEDIDTVNEGYTLDFKYPPTTTDVDRIVYNIHEKQAKVQHLSGYRLLVDKDPRKFMSTEDKSWVECMTDPKGKVSSFISAQTQSLIRGSVGLDSIVFDMPDLDHVADYQKEDRWVTEDSEDEDDLPIIPDVMTCPKDVAKSMMDMFASVRKRTENQTEEDTVKTEIAELMVIFGFLPPDLEAAENLLQPKESRKENPRQIGISATDERELCDRMKSAIATAEKYGFMIKYKQSRRIKK